MNCAKCSKVFPSKIIIDGKKRNLKSRRYCLSCSPFGKHNTKQLVEHPAEKLCNECSLVLTSENAYLYKSGRRAGQFSTQCRKCAISRLNEKTRSNKQILVDEHGGKCCRCQYDNCIDGLAFHHVDEKTKSFEISSSGGRNLTLLRAEARKCILLCLICHAEKHAGLW